jgi:demethylmenaquinone methyltransferase/2-methoxy-6-polyprenyl-1,4-benzoquinol methylase
LALAFHSAAPRARILALDFTPAMVRGGAAKSARAGMAAGGRPHSAATPLCFGLADALALPLRDDSMAAAGIAFGLRNVADPMKAIRELARVVRPGGKVVVLEFSIPSGRCFGPLYRFYFRRVLPRLAGCLAHGAGDAYRYLPDSVDAFVKPEGVTELLRKAGMPEVRATPLAGGAVHLHVGRKPGPCEGREGAAGQSAKSADTSRRQPDSI